MNKCLKMVGITCSAVTLALAADVAVADPTFQPSSEASYVPITPCRIVDTRMGVGDDATPIVNGETRPYYVGGTFGFAPQGGKSGGCGIPVGAVSIAAVMTAVTPTNAGFIRAWPNGQAEPTATILNYGATSNGTGSNLTISTTGAIALEVKNYGGPTHLVIDVQGYYAKPLAGMISSSGTPYAGSSRIVSSSRAAAGVYDVVFDRNIRYCTATATVYSSNYYASITTYYSSNENSVRVYVWDSAGAPADQYFYIAVHC
jgi:hypothetical protein